MKNIGIIPARSGSKGLPGKNIKIFNNKPLIAYTILAALDSGIFDQVVVSTDSHEYAEIAVKYGAVVPFLRSKKNSTDNASSYDVICEVLDYYKHRGVTYDTFCLLQPTSPLRNARDIVNAYSIYEKKKATSVISVCEVDYHPDICNTLPADGCMNGFLDKHTQKKGRQLLERSYRINGAIYISECEIYVSTGDFYQEKSYSYIMDKERSFDIDNWLDFYIAEQVARVLEEKTE